MSWKDQRYAAAAAIRKEQPNIYEDEQRLDTMNGDERPGPLEGDTDDSGQFIYTRVGTTAWGTPIMKWRRWGF